MELREVKFINGSRVFVEDGGSFFFMSHNPSSEPNVDDGCVQGNERDFLPMFLQMTEDLLKNMSPDNRPMFIFELSKLISEHSGGCAEVLLVKRDKP